MISFSPLFVVTDRKIRYKRNVIGIVIKTMNVKKWKVASNQQAVFRFKAKTKRVDRYLTQVDLVMKLSFIISRTLYVTDDLPRNEFDVFLVKKLHNI
jgi:hypothetical protein